MSTETSGLAKWLEGRATKWKSLNSLYGKLSSGKGDINDIRELVSGFRGLAKDLSIARIAIPGGKVYQYLIALFSSCHELIYRKASHPWQELKTIYVYEVPRLVRGELRGPIIATVSMFVGSGIIGWMLVTAFPELIGLVASETMISKVQQGELWTDDLLNIMPSSILSLSIMTNNIVVALMAFVIGALYGIGTIYIIVLNGLMLGAIFAFTAQYNMAGRLFEFVMAHGVVELSIICLAGAAGIQLGEALVRPGQKTRMAAFQDTVGMVSKLMLVVVPFLIGAGLIEGFVSPNDSYGMASRVVIGLGYGIILWGALTGNLYGKRE